MTPVSVAEACKGDKRFSAFYMTSLNSFDILKPRPPEDLDRLTLEILGDAWTNDTLVHKSYITSSISVEADPAVHRLFLSRSEVWGAVFFQYGYSAASRLLAMPKEHNFSKTTV
jgi:hypothetical protein